MGFERWARGPGRSPVQDEAGLTPWEFEPALLADLRLGVASQALDDGQPERALVEAEQLLRRHPDDLQALGVVGRAAILVGDGDMAAAALSRVVGEDEANADGWSLYSLALTLGFRYEEGRLAALQAVELDPELAVAWHHLALAQERLGEELAARRSFRRAAALAPTVLPRPRVWAELTWARCLEAARDKLPLSSRLFYQRVPVCWRDLPAVEDLPDGATGLSPFAGAYASLPDDDGERLPECIVLFRRNLARGAADAPQLTERIFLALRTQAVGWMRGG